MAAGLGSRRRSSRHRKPLSVPREECDMPSVIDLMRIPVERRTPDHLFEMLRCAVKLEHATLPPYLTAWWSITLPKHPADPKNPSYDILQTIVFEEMGHMGTALNLLTTVGGTPAI